MGRLAPGLVRDAIRRVMEESSPEARSLDEIHDGVERLVGTSVPSSSVRSGLNLHPELYVSVDRGSFRFALAQEEEPLQGFQDEATEAEPAFISGQASLFHSDSLAWLRTRTQQSIHGVVTDPPYGLVEYSAEQQLKLRARKGGIWRIPPSYDGHTRAPLPRFTTLSSAELDQLDRFFRNWAELLLPTLVPGAHVLVAANPLVSHRVSTAMGLAGLERRGEIVRLVQTMRGGDRPKNAHEEYPDVSVMPRSMWEPWLLFRKPIEGTVARNLRAWGTGGLRRVSDEKPFGDVIRSAPTGVRERAIAGHPSLKPQAFLRQVVRAILPLGEGVVLDPFCGSGSTLAAANAVGYDSVGVETDSHYIEIAKSAIPELSRLDQDAQSRSK